MKPKYNTADPEDCGEYRSQDNAYVCAYCDSYGYLGYSKQECCQICSGKRRVVKNSRKKKDLKNG
jgi:hypothetical protein